MVWCAKFDLFPNNTILGNNFNHSNVQFTSLNGTSIYVNETSNERGITINPPGIVVRFPVPASNLTIRLGFWDGYDVEVVLYNSNMIELTRFTAQGTNEYKDFLVQHNEISYLELNTHGNEELLVSICMEF
jgi:hypothetical protein